MTPARVLTGAAPALRVEGVSKRFGKHRALDGLGFAVPTGSLCGLVGENGAGKTTCLSIVAGFLHADAGTVDLLGLGPFTVAKHRGRVGVLPQDAELPEAHTPSSLLGTWARLQGLGAEQSRLAVAAALADVQLEAQAHTRVKALSHGMRRRLAVASALLGWPELVLLDEPTAGLDPSQARHLRQVLAAERGRRTVLVSSHNLAELESLCDHVIVIERGRCVLDEGMDTVTGRDREATIILDEPVPEGLVAVTRVRASDDPGGNLAAATTRALAGLIAQGARVREVRRGDALEARYFAENAPSRPG